LDTQRFEELQKHLEELKEQNSALERDVQRFQMRERQLEKVWKKIFFTTVFKSSELKAHLL